MEPIDEKPVIAVIDDEDKWLKVYKRMFRSSHYSIEPYSDPHRFLDTITKYPDRFAGIICDINMPGLNGHRVFEAVKKDTKTRNIPFLIVSGVLTQDQNLSKIQTAAYVSKMDDDLRSKIFEELIAVIENWPRIKHYLHTQDVPEEDIDFFCQFFINYQTFFNEILDYIHQMEQACVDSNHDAIIQITNDCMAFMEKINNKCMGIISLIQESQEISAFTRKLCTRARSSLNMIQYYQLIFSEESTSNKEFQVFLADCRQSIEKIILGTEEGYNLRKD